MPDARLFNARNLRWVGAMILLVALVALGPRLAAATLLNMAQLGRLRGVELPGLYEQALRLTPHDQRLQEQTAQALVRAGDLEGAATILLALADARPPAAVSTERLLVELLIATGRHELAQKRIEAASPALTLAPDAAAALWLGLQAEGRRHPEAEHRLLGWLLHLAPQAEPFQRLSTYLQESQAARQGLAEALTWQAACFPRIAGVLERCAAPSPAGVGSTAEPVIAALLEVPHEAIRLGPELVEGGDFEPDGPCVTCQPPSLSLNYPPGWLPSVMADGQTWNLGAFSVGFDASHSVSGQYSLRIDGLIVEREMTLEPARAGMLYTGVELEAGEPYVVSFYYRTEGTSGLTSTLWLSPDPLILTAGDYPLPPTDGAWRRVLIIGWNRNVAPATIQPILRSFGEGHVWFDAFSVRPIDVAVHVAPADPRVVIEEL